MEEVKKNNKVMFLEIFLIICMCLVTFSGTIEPLVNARTIIYIALLGIAVVLVALKREKLILESFRNMLSERGKIQCFYSDEEKDTLFDKIEYKSNPSVNNDMAYVYTYKNKEIEK